MNVNRRVAVVCLLVAVAGSLAAQNPTKPVYLESFRKGSSRVTETAYDVTLDARNPRSKARVLDATGRERYVLMFEPQQGGPSDNRFVSWHAALADLRHHMYKNVLTPSLDPLQDKLQVWWFNPNPYAVVGFRSLRVVKVENFYCALQVTDHRFVAPGDPRLASITVNVRFLNSNPLQAVEKN
jgi:hypothetical protein